MTLRTWWVLGVIAVVAVGCSTEPTPTPTPVVDILRQTFDLDGSPKTFQTVDIPSPSEVTLGVVISQEATDAFICAVPTVWDADGNRIAVLEPRTKTTSGAIYQHTFVVASPGEVSLDLHNADCDTHGVKATAQVTWRITPN